MSTSSNVETAGGVAAGQDSLQTEFRHLKLRWCWLFAFGILLTVCGALAIIVPAATVKTSVVAMIVLGILLMLTGVATIVGAFWAGKWSGLVPQLLCGVLYLVSGFVIYDAPVGSAVMMAALIAAMFIVLGLFRVVISLVLRFPHWGWTLLNGVVTLLCGVVIFRHFPQSAMWVVGLLVGLEMLFHGWNWIMLSLAIRNIPDVAA